MCALLFSDELMQDFSQSLMEVVWQIWHNIIIFIILKIPPVEYTVCFVTLIPFLQLCLYEYFNQTNYFSDQKYIALNALLTPQAV